MGKPVFSLTLANRLDELARIADALESCGAKLQWPSRWIFEINLAVDELVTNIINHGYADQNHHQIELTGRVVDDKLIVTIVDDARAFNPLSDAPPPDLTADVDARQVGGLGVHLVRELIDEVAYHHRDGKNHLTLTQARVKPQ